MQTQYDRYAELRGDRKDSDVARETGIPQSTLSDWKAGRYTPKLDKIKRIADYFGVPIEELLKEPAEA